jgi:aspartokinase
MFAIGGIKLSQELTQFNLFWQRSADFLITRHLARIAECKINLTFLSQSAEKKDGITSFCVDAGDAPQVEQIVAVDVSPICQIEIIAPVGTITIFPHRRSFFLLGSVVEALGQANIPIHAVSTSLSSLAINTDFRLLDRAIEELEKVLEIPDNHAPYRPELNIEPLVK